MNDWSIDLPNWTSQSDPEIKGSTVWIHTDYDGQPDLALVSDIGLVSVLSPVLITPTEIDGENLGSFTDWETALEFALAHLEQV